MNELHKTASQIAAEVVDARTARELHKDGADALWVRRLVEEGIRRALIKCGWKGTVLDIDAILAGRFEQSDKG